MLLYLGPEMEMIDIDKQMELIKRGAVDLIDEGELRRKLARGKPLRIKAGFDPTAPDLHLGHSVLIQKLKHFQELGHQVIFLIGDFTGMIGDPSGRSDTRPALTREQVLTNAETYKAQVFKILDPSKTTVEFNSNWMSGMSSADFIRLASHYNVARMLEREDFRNRYETGQSISVHEFLYPLVQGYDSVALKADVELGGTDQRFNLLMGRHLQTHYGQEPQCILTTPLLEGLDGVKKMSKSLGNYIGITDPPGQIFGKIMSISDELMWRYYELLSDLSLATIALLRQKVEAGDAHPKAVKESLAFELASRYHDEAAALAAKNEFHAVFSKGGAPDDMPLVTIASGDENSAPAILEKAGAVGSRGEARRLIRQGALFVNDARWEEETAPLPVGEHILKLGKKRFIRAVIA